MHGKSSLRTPLGQVRGLGSAKAGTEHFWLQRVTAVSNVVLASALVIVLATLPGQSYGEAMDTLSNPLVAILLLLFVTSGLIHMRIGMQVIIEDYVHGEAAKVVALLANNFFAIGVGIASAFAILKIAFGG